MAGFGETRAVTCSLDGDTLKEVCACLPWCYELYRPKQYKNNSRSICGSSGQWVLRNLEIPSLH